jgi:pre-mRNA-splicing factor SYF1
MLWENSYFEEVFRVFEFAVGHFKWPNVYEIWLSYISRFIERYGSDGVGVERTRSIFERLLKEIPQ